MTISKRDPASNLRRIIKAPLVLASLPAGTHTMGQFLWLLSPLFFAIFGIKVYKSLFALWPIPGDGWHPLTFSQFIVDHRTLKFALFLGFCCMLGVITTRRPKLNYYIFVKLLMVLGVTSAMLVVVLGGVDQIAHYLDAVLAKLNKYTQEVYFALAFFRSDILFGLAYYAVYVLAVRYSPPAKQWIIIGTVLLLNAILLLLAGIDLAYYLKSGVAASGELLRYFVRSMLNEKFREMLFSGCDWRTVATVFLPLLAASAVQLAIYMFRSNRITPEHIAVEQVLVRSGLAIWPALVGMMMMPTHLDPRYLRLSGNTFTTIGRDLFVAPLFNERIKVDTNSLAKYQTASIKFEEAPGATPHNVVIIMLESVRASATGIYNRSLTNTPFLSELAKKSLVADSMHAVIVRTTAAWIGVLQGIFPSTSENIIHWAGAEARSRKTTSLPRLLRSHGYRSAFFVPTHLEFEKDGQVLSNMDFDLVVSEGDYDAAAFERVNYFGFEDRVMLGPILGWVNERRRDGSRFFLTVMTNVGHSPYETPSYWRKVNYVDQPSAIPEVGDYNNYLNCIAYVDDFLGRLFDGFAQQGILESTIFMILGDHGTAFGEHGVAFRGGMELYEEHLHIPMLVYAPALIRTSGRIQGPRSQVDIIPSIADMLGYRIEGGVLPGVSLLAKAPAERKIFFSDILDQSGLALLEKNRKYIYTYDRLPMQVFDLSVDAQESRDISASVDSGQLKRVKQELRHWFEQSKMSFLAAVH